MPSWHQKSTILTHPKNVRRTMENQRITVRLPQTDLHSIDLFIRAGEFSSRSEVIRHAVNDFIKNYAQQVIEKAEKMKKVQALEMAVESIEPYMKK
jgi:Arc/MetJ-type ribon-helix-helix transcriptional regulator